MQIVATIPLTNRELSPTVGGKPPDQSCVPVPYSDCPSRLAWQGIRVATVAVVSRAEDQHTVTKRRLPRLTLCHIAVP
jgi:hypothetical protein